VLHIILLPEIFMSPLSKGLGYKTSKAPDGQGPLLTNYKPKL
jgi:hypothetical protein